MEMYDPKIPRAMQPQGQYGAQTTFKHDPSKWRPQYYQCTIQLGGLAGETGIATVTLNNTPFIVQRITHCILGNTNGTQIGNPYVIQDGQYTIEFKDEHTSFQNSPTQADATFGSVRTGNFIDLPAPIAYPGSTTISFGVTNLVDRQDGQFQPTPFRVQIIMHGLQQWSS